VHGDAAARTFGSRHPILRVRERCNLWQVGDHENLRPRSLRYPGQRATDCLRRLPAHTGVHLVEDHRRRVGAGDE
jgi:hypothetical protein